jgi:formate dehydrogenase subunit beta
MRQRGEIMNIHWMLLTRGDVLGTTREFLRDLWLGARLEGMVAPRYAPGGLGVKPDFMTDWTQLDQVDPFAPVMTTNAAQRVMEVAHALPPPQPETALHRNARVGAVLRSCEVRALAELAKRESFSLDRVLIIGVDCLGTFPAEEYEWRAEKYGVEQVTSEVLQFARQGGILAYRYRRACQMCSSPMPPETADVSLGVLGLPAREVILVTARNADTGRRLQLERITNAVATPERVAQHAQMRQTLLTRHRRAHDRILSTLPAGLPADLSELKAHLAHCAPCQACLDACPLYHGEFSPLGNGDTATAMRRWLAMCVQCGLCEEACPKHLPLAALFERLVETHPAAGEHRDASSLAV